MSIKFEKDPTDFVIKPEDRLNKSNIMKSELDAKTSELGAGHPYDEGDVRDWNSIRAAGYSMKLDGCKGFSVHKDGKEIGCAGSTNPGSPLMSSELRNHFKRAVQIATNHQLSEASASIRDGVQPTFLSGEVWGDEGTIPDDQETVNIHDGAPLDELKEETQADANGGDAQKSLAFTEDDLMKSDQTLGNQGWVKKSIFGRDSKMRNVAADGGMPAKQIDMAGADVITSGFRGYHGMKETHDVLWTGEGKIGWKKKPAGAGAKQQEVIEEVPAAHVKKAEGKMPKTKMPKTNSSPKMSIQGIRRNIKDLRDERDAADESGADFDDSELDHW